MSANPEFSLFRKSTLPPIRRSDLTTLISMIESSDFNPRKFGTEIARHPGVLKLLMRAANSSLIGGTWEIRDPGHAALFLGSRRVSFLLNTLPPELIEEEREKETDAA